MTEGQITSLSREAAKGLQHLRKHGVIHRSIEGVNLLLSLTGDIKHSTYHEFPPDMICDPRRALDCS